MHPRLRLPRVVAARVAAQAAGVHGFDLDTQRVASLPAFQGVRVWQDFCTEVEARALLEAIEGARFAPAQSGKSKQHFGAKVNFKRRKLASAGFQGLPPYVRWIEARLAERVAGEAARLRRVFDSFRATDAFVLRYAPERDSNLDFHVDDTFAYGEGIFGLSLESDSVLSFVPDVPPEIAPEETIVRVPLPARSGVVLCGPARTAWQHGILAEDVRARRTSVTLRTLGDDLAETDAGRRWRELVDGEA